MWRGLRRCEPNCLAPYYLCCTMFSIVISRIDGGRTIEIEEWILVNLQHDFPTQHCQCTHGMCG